MGLAKCIRCGVVGCMLCASPALHAVGHGPHPTEHRSQTERQVIPQEPIQRRPDHPDDNPEEDFRPDAYPFPDENFTTTTPSPGSLPRPVETKKVLQAYWGSGRCVQNVTRVARQKYRAGQRRFPATNDEYGDVAPNHKKALFITFQDGLNEPQTFMALEGDSICLPN